MWLGMAGNCSFLQSSGLAGFTVYEHFKPVMTGSEDRYADRTEDKIERKLHPGTSKTSKTCKTQPLFFPLCMHIQAYIQLFICE